MSIIFKIKNNMKNYILISIFSVVLLSCSSSGGDGDGGGGSTDDNPIVNTAPSIPVLSNPTNNLLCIDNNLVFDWAASDDAEGDAVKYTLELSTDNQFTQLTHSFDNLSVNNKTILLDKGIAYYWRVKALDSKNESSDYSSVFQLYTEGLGEVNHLPFLPAVTTPLIDETVTGTSAFLSWGASDTDVDDVLTYDIYLDTNSDPATMIASAQADKEYTAAALNAATTYYWKVVVKDDKGGITYGPVWSFKTE